MSTRLTRVLRRLYPRQMRERYGDELLALQAELRERGELSRAGLIGDAIRGAVLARSRQPRSPITVLVVAVVAALALTGGLIAGGGLHSSGSRLSGPLALAKIGSLAMLRFGHTCLVGSSSLCSPPPCTKYVVVMNPTTGNIVAQGSVATPPGQRAACAAAVSRPRIVPVHG